jgi:hypothetical protein
MPQTIRQARYDTAAGAVLTQRDRNSLTPVPKALGWT